MKRVKALVFVVAVLLLASSLMTACLDSHKKKKETDNEKVIIRVDFASDELLGKYDSYIDKYEGPEYVPKVLISTNTAAKGFKFIELGYREEDSDIVFFEDSVLFTLDELLPGKPLVVGIDFTGVLPTKGLAYLDENNAVKHFSINESGNDGSLFLLEF